MTDAATAAARTTPDWYQPHDWRRIRQGAVGRSDRTKRVAEGKIDMNNINIVAAAALVQIFILWPIGSANAISVDLAKKCRALAIKSHPPTRAGTAPYAHAERDYFRECVDKNGDILEPPERKPPPAKTQ